MENSIELSEISLSVHGVSQSQMPDGICEQRQFVLLC